MSAISGTRRAMKEMADGTIRVSIDIDPRYRHEFLRDFSQIDMPIAIVPLAADFEQARPEEPKSKGGLLSQWLALRYTEPDFKGYMAGTYGITSDLDVACKKLLEIESKKELDNDPEAADRFHAVIRIPYAKWLHGMRK